MLKLILNFFFPYPGREQYQTREHTYNDSINAVTPRYITVITAIPPIKPIVKLFFGTLISRPKKPSAVPPKNKKYKNRIAPNVSGKLIGTDTHPLATAVLPISAYAPEPHTASQATGTDPKKPDSNTPNKTTVKTIVETKKT